MPIDIGLAKIFVLPGFYPMRFKLTCFLIGHDLILYRQMSGYKLHCRRCCDPYAYTLAERLRQLRSRLASNQRLKPGEDNIPF